MDAVLHMGRNGQYMAVRGRHAGGTGVTRKVWGSGWLYGVRYGAVRADTGRYGVPGHGQRRGRRAASRRCGGVRTGTVRWYGAAGVAATWSL